MYPKLQPLRKNRGSSEQTPDRHTTSTMLELRRLLQHTLSLPTAYQLNRELPFTVNFRHEKARRP